MEGLQTSASGSGLTGSRLRSSRVPSNPYEASPRPEASSLPTSTPAPIPGLEEVLKILQSSELPGPNVILGPYRYIGTGGQFVVHRGHFYVGKIASFDLFEVAIKSPRFDTNLSERIRLTDRSAQKHLKSLSAEIKALTTPALRQHPNIVQLLCWTYDPYSLHSQPALIMELASSDLYKLLQEKGEKILHQQRHTFCSDIASGLDAIHEWGFVHGDLKPGNILIFANQSHLIAKIADFGLSVGDLDDAEASVLLTGTPGWQAPEVERGQLLVHQGIMADSYSFGLVAWSAFFGSGERPPGSNAEERRDHIISELKETSSRKKAGLHLAGIFENALTLLLQEDPSQRPNKLEGLFGINKKSKYVESRRRFTNTTTPGSRSNGLNGVQESLQVNFREGQFEPNRLPWELHPSHAFKKDLLFRYMDDPDSVPGDFLFTYFLELTMLEESSGFRIQPKHYSLLDVFETAAKRGFPPAQAIVPDVFAFYGKPIPSETDEQLTSCLENAVRTGSTFARRHLQSRDPVALSISMKFFEAKGGYGMFYAAGGSNHRIHSIVASGHVDDLKDYLCQVGEVDINSTTIHGEPPLYLACLRGSWDMATELLNRGATAPGNYSQYGTACLHWVFAFDPSIQSLAVKKLVEGGVDIDSKASQSPPFFHYPFELPAGTPLHWAVATGSHTAIRALVEHGANLNIRDGCDPYRYDHRVRILGSFGPRIEDVYSYSETGTQGLSPLDYAAIHHDPFIFELLLMLRKSVPINDVDEEGFTIMHRLSTLAERRTRSGVRFSFLPFQGDPVESAGRLARTIAAIKSLGGDLEKLTTPNVNKAQAEQNGGQLMDWEGDTPLMLAARGGRPSVVRALLEAGADVNHENKAGIMALHCISENRHVVAEIASLLVSAGAAVSHKTGDGATPLQRAASMRAIEMMDLLLSHGADVEEVDTYKRSPFQGSSVFAHLARPAYNTMDASDETYDEAVAGLIEKHILSAHVNVDERLRVVTRGAPGSTTLLGLFSQLLMRHTVSMLIRCGADVNAISRTRKTPLDTAIEAKESEELVTKRRRHRTLSQYEKICMRREAVIKIIQDSGGRRSTD